MLLQLLQKLGSAEKTTDPQFEEQRKNWDNMLKKLQNIDRDMKKLSKIESEESIS
jgi:hypothetical protein